jgi:hypothetical protein
LQWIYLSQPKGHIKLLSQTNLGPFDQKSDVILSNPDLLFPPEYSNGKIFFMDSSKTIKPNPHSPFPSIFSEFYGNPRIRSVYNPDFEFGYPDIKIQDSLVLLGQEDGLKILDISNPSTPYTIGKITLPSKVKLVAAEGDYAYIVDFHSGFYILDISHPSNPKIMSYFKKLSKVDQIDGMVINQNKAYLYNCYSIYIFDISQSTEPRLLGSFTPKYGPCPTSQHAGKDDLVIVGDTMFINESWKSSSDPVMEYYFSTVDISNPAHPTYLGSYDADEHYGYDFYGNSRKEVYMNSGNYLRIVDFSNPQHPSGVDSFQFLSPIWSISYGTNHLVYVIDMNNNFYTLQYQP